LSNPTAKIKPIKVPKRLRFALNDEQLELLREGCNNIRQRSIIEILYSTGCRVSEIKNLNVSDINWSQMSFKVIGKGNKERIVYFTAKAKLLLLNYLDSKKIKTTAVFTNSKKPYNRLSTRSIEKEVNQIKINAGLQDLIITPHIMRHSMATHMINSNMSITTLQTLLGHSSPATTTQIYAEVDQENMLHEYRKSL
jgi:integrase/recombinase XerD